MQRTLNVGWGAWVVIIVLAAAPSWTNASGPLSFAYRDGRPVGESKAGLRGHEAKLSPVAGKVHVYATLEMGPVNPLKYVDGRPQWREEDGRPAATEPDKLASSETLFHQPEPIVTRRGDRLQNLQIVVLGHKSGEKFIPAVSFGLADDGRAELESAHVTPWLSDGKIDYFGAYARPNTPYDFKLSLDLNKARMTAWVSGRGDDDWLLLAENVPLAGNVDVINHVQVLQYPGGPTIGDLQVAGEPIAALEHVRPHPLAKKHRVVGRNKGFQFQSMRST